MFRTRRGNEIDPLTLLAVIKNAPYTLADVKLELGKKYANQGNIWRPRTPGEAEGKKA